MMNENYLLDPDVQLMLKFKQGDKLAFGELLDKYQKPVINIIYRFIQDKSEADDLAQEVFIKVYNNAKSYEARAKFSTWLYRITKNVCLNELRRRKRKIVSLDEAVSASDDRLKQEVIISGNNSPLEDSAAHELQEIVKQAINSLPANQRMAVILRRYEEMPYEDIARTIGCSVKAIKSLLNRAKEALKNKLAAYVLMQEK